MTLSCEECGGVCCTVLNIDMSGMEPDRRRLVSMRGVVGGGWTMSICFPAAPGPVDCQHGSSEVPGLGRSFIGVVT